MWLAPVRTGDTELEEELPSGSRSHDTIVVHVLLGQLDHKVVMRMPYVETVTLYPGW
jgi:hypothetical protein